LKQFPKIIKPAYKVPEWIKEKRAAERASAGSSKDEL